MRMQARNDAISTHDLLLFAAALRGLEAVLGIEIDAFVGRESGTFAVVPRPDREVEVLRDLAKVDWKHLIRQAEEWQK